MGKHEDLKEFDKGQIKEGVVVALLSFGQETLGDASLSVDLTLTRITYQNIVADHEDPFMERVFFDGCGFFQHYNVPCHKVKMVQEGFGGPIWQLKGLKGSAANILVPDTEAHCQGPSGVHASTGQ